MKSFLAVARLELTQRRFVLFAGAVLATFPWLVPLLPGLTGHTYRDMRVAISLFLGIGFALGVALLLGAALFAPDLMTRKIGFHLARPVPSASLFSGRLAGACLVLAASSTAILLPAMLALAGRNPADLGLGGLPIWPVVALASFLFLLAANAASVALRAKSRWIVIDAILLPALALVVWTASRRLHLAACDALLQAALVALALVLIAALLAAGLAQVALGRTDALRAHGALSMTLWTVLLPATAVYDVASRWAAGAGPSDLRGIQTIAVAPNGPWIAVEGTAARRLGAPAALVVDTRSGRFVRLGPAAEVAFSADGKRVVVKPIVVSGFGVMPFQRRDARAQLQVVDLDAPRPVAASTGIELAGNASPILALSPDGSRLAVYMDRTLEVYDLASRALLAAAKTEQEASYELRFVTPSRVRLAPRWYPSSRIADRHEKIDSPGTQASLPLQELDVDAKRLERTGSVDATVATSFQTSPDHALMLRTERGGLAGAAPAPVVSLLDARTGVARTDCPLEGVKRAAFLADGRLVLLRAGPERSSLEVASTACVPEKRIDLPPADTLSFLGEPVPGVLAVLAAQRSSAGAGVPPAPRAGSQVLLVDLASGGVKEAPGVRPAMPVWVRTSFVPGSDGARLFATKTGALVSLDPKSGETRTVLGQ